MVGYEVTISNHTIQRSSVNLYDTSTSLCVEIAAAYHKETCLCFLGFKVTQNIVSCALKFFIGELYYFWSVIKSKKYRISWTGRCFLGCGGLSSWSSAPYGWSSQVLSIVRSSRLSAMALVSR